MKQRFEYLCNSCEFHGLLMRDSIERAATTCPICGNLAVRTYSKLGLCYTESSRLTNRGFNNNQGVFDPSIGKMCYSRQHRKELQAEMGLVDFTPEDVERAGREDVIKPETEEVRRDRWERSEAMVANGWRAPRAPEHVKQARERLDAEDSGNHIVVDLDNADMS